MEGMKQSVLIADQSDEDKHRKDEFRCPKSVPSPVLANNVARRSTALLPMLSAVKLVFARNDAAISAAGIHASRDSARFAEYHSKCPQPMIGSIVRLLALASRITCNGTDKSNASAVIVERSFSANRPRRTRQPAFIAQITACVFQLDAARNSPVNNVARCSSSPPLP